MCKAIEKALRSAGMGLENEISEIDILVAEDEAIMKDGLNRKLRRMNRRAAEAAKKHSLGKKAKYMREDISAYFVTKDGDKKVINWLFSPEGCEEWVPAEWQKYWNEIQWNNVKAVNAENRGYSSESSGRKSNYDKKDRYQRFDPEEDPVFDHDVIDPATGEIVAMKGENWYQIEFFDVKNYKNWYEIQRRYPENRNYTIEDGCWVLTYRDGAYFPILQNDSRLADKLNSAKAEIEKHRNEQVLALEEQRAELFAKIHEINWEIGQLLNN